MQVGITSGGASPVVGATVVMRDMARARTQIKALVGGEIKLIPTDHGYLEAELAGDYTGLLKLIQESPGTGSARAKLSLVAGARYQPFRIPVSAFVPIPR